MRNRATRNKEQGLRDSLVSPHVSITPHFGCAAFFYHGLTSRSCTRCACWSRRPEANASLKHIV